MELILQAPSLSVEGARQKEIISGTYEILKIDNSLAKNGHQHISEKINSKTVTVAEAATLLETNGVDVILITPNSINEQYAKVKELARKKAIPVVLYTPTFESSAKNTAFSIAADDYHHGAINGSFIKRVEFIKKVKSYKNQRGPKRTPAMALDQVPQIKLWSMKRAFDIFVSATALLMLLPLCVIIAVAIKLESKGPIFYISKRAGSGYRIFNFYKFRSMRTGSDEELAKLTHMNQYGKSVFFKIKNDPRITRLGEFLRKSSLDEIPQLLNVLLGDMSLVGNRPLPLYEAEKLTKDQIAWRFLAPAGITGLWQITKRGKSDMSEDERIALDIEYAMKNSFWLDMKILFSTIPALLQKENV